MKKFVILFILCLIGGMLSSSAVDYTKLQAKELKHAQKYGSTQRYFDKSEIQTPVSYDNTAVSMVKDPKIMKFGNYTKVDDAKYNAKMKTEDTQYAKIETSLRKRTVNNYNAQAKGEDYYKLYRIAEKIIRANNLDYQNWRIGVYRDAESPNAYSTNNYVSISTSLFDTFQDNDDALAFIIGHEFGHALLGHQQRIAPTISKLQRLSSGVKAGNEFSQAAFVAMKKKYLIDSRNMEYSADLEGAKLALKAGYNLNKAMDVVGYMETLPHDYTDKFSTHPDPAKRKANLNQNSKYFIGDEWKEMGKTNIYNSDVLKVSQSSDRKSIVISGDPRRLNSGEYYRPETLNELYARMGYKSYVYGELNKSVEYFNKLFEIDRTNAPAYLYASYASEALYKNTGKKKFREEAKTYAKSACMIEPNNKYMKEQLDSL